MKESFPQSHVFHGDPTLDPMGNTNHYTAPTAIWNKPRTKMGGNDATTIKNDSLSQRLDAIEAQLKQIAELIKTPQRQRAIPRAIPIAKSFGEWLAQQDFKK